VSSSLKRERNPRGRGGQLRNEIVEAARELLAESGSEHAVTLRAVARRVGIAAPSIYAHFETPEQIVQAVVAETFGALVDHLEAARTGKTDPRERLLASCRAYLTFGAQQPALYRLIFSQPLPSPDAGDSVQEGVAMAAPADPETAAAVERVRARTGADAFGLLIADVSDAVSAGASHAHDILTTATALWVSLHGLVVLRATAPEFPWPDAEQLETELITRVALLDQKQA
jgi:AcrR family transcriptional regulator